MSSAFRDLHQSGNPFILANAWDAGSAKLLTAAGAQAIATTSAGQAFTLGVKDMGYISREQAIQHARELNLATPLPVSGDFENGYGDSPDEVAVTINKAAQAGLAGCCIEDVALPGSSAYDFDLAVQRIAAGAQAARAQQDDFVLVARADGVMNGQYDMAEAIRRIQAFAEVGADVLYVPMPPSMEDLQRICKAVDKPVNALAAGHFAQYRVSDFANAGVARISLGSALARVTHAAILNSAKALFEEGEFSSFTLGISGTEVESLFDQVDRTLLD